MSSSSFIRGAFVTLAVAFSVAGCATAPVAPQSTVSRDLDSGVTSNNGGGMRPANFGSSAPVRTQ